MARRLIDSLIGERARAAHNTNLALAVDVAWHDADLAFAGFDDTGAVWSNQTRFVLRLHDRLDFDHVEGGNALRNANNEIHLSVNSLQVMVMAM